MTRTLFTNAFIWSCRAWLAAFFILVGHSQAQGQFVYVNNDTVPNTVSTFQIDSQGALIPVPDSPFPTGGLGRPNYGIPTNATIHIRNDFLFACNVLSNTISVFAINPDGSLDDVPGSPFASGGRSPLGLITNAQGSLLFVSNYDTARLSVFTVAANGVLEAVPGSPISLSPLRLPTSMAINSTGTLLLIGGADMLGVYSVTPDGQIARLGDFVNTGFQIKALALTENDRFIYAAGDSGIAAFQLSTSGQLTPVNGSPFSLGSPNGFLGLAVNSRGNLLAATVPKGANVYLFRIESNGTLRPATGSPFSTKGTELVPIGFDPNGNFVFTADVANHSIHVFRTNPLGRALTEIATSPFDAGDSKARPSGIAVK